MIRPSKKYIDYCNAIDNLYNLGFIHEMKISQEQFDKLSVEQQNKRIADLSKIKKPEQYVMINDGRQTKVDKALFERFENAQNRLLKYMPKLSGTGVNGKALFKFFDELNIDRLTPDTNMSWVGKTPEYLARITRDGLVSELSALARECPYPDLESKYNTLIAYIKNMTPDELMTLVAKTDGLDAIMTPITETYISMIDESMIDELYNDTKQEYKDYIDSVMAHRW